MNTAEEHRSTKVKPKRKLAVTLAISAPIIFLVISLFSGFVMRKEIYHV